MIIFPRAVYDDLIDHAAEGVPQEVCGVLGGIYDVEVSRVGTSERATNAATAPKYEYAIDPEEQLALMESLESDDHTVVGFYHSHPSGPARPSDTDAERAMWPRRSYVIVVQGGRHPFVGSWRWNDAETRFEPEIVQVTGGPSESEPNR